MKGRKIYIDWVTTTPRDGKQKHGVTVVEVKPDGTHAEGWSVSDGGTGGERWSAVPGTTAKPVGPAGKPPKDTKPEGAAGSTPLPPDKPATPDGGRPSRSRPTSPK